jgi:large conductance mechanosensitive channel
VLVMPMNKLAERRKAGEEPEPEAPAEDVLLLGEIRDLLKAGR